VRWRVGALARWCVSSLVRWCVGAFAHWYVALEVVDVVLLRGVVSCAGGTTLEGVMVGSLFGDHCLEWR